jgi:hypothetical protein
MVLWLHTFLKGVPVYLTLPFDIPKELPWLTRSFTDGERGNETQSKGTLRPI